MELSEIIAGMHDIFVWMGRAFAGVGLILFLVGVVQLRKTSGLKAHHRRNGAKALVSGIAFVAMGLGLMFYTEDMVNFMLNR